MSIILRTTKITQIFIETIFSDYINHSLSLSLSLQITTMLLPLTLVKDDIHWIIKHDSVTTPKGKYKP